jgi:hypothetical protein
VGVVFSWIFSAGFSRAVKKTHFSLFHAQEGVKCAQIGSEFGQNGKFI